MLNSFELSDLLVARNFRRLSKETRTKAHGFEHPTLTHPLYLKVSGGSKKGPLVPAVEAPLVVHADDHRKIANAGVPAGVRLKSTEYTSTGLSRFKADDGKTPHGCDYWIESVSALDSLLSLLGLDIGQQPALQIPSQSLEQQALGIEGDSDPALDAETPSVRQALINARIGQGDYRRDLLELWGSCCAVTGCSVTVALIASHAKPWSACETTHERLDKYNGLLLVASIDKLFDQGLISFADDGELLRKPGLSDDDLAHLGLRSSARLRADCLHSRHLPYLAAHRARHGF